MKKIIKSVLMGLLIYALAITLGITLFSHRFLATAQAPHLDAVVDVELLPELIPICACESVGDREAVPQHKDKNGDVIRGKVDGQDIGMCQINLRYNGEYAAELGLNVFSERDNKIFANVLYTERGTAPWNASSSCWR